MVFSSIIFLLYFFPVVFILYFLLNNKIKNAFLLLVSVLFYMWGAPKFIFAILLTTCIDFFLVNTLNNATSEKRRKLFLILSLSLNVSMLFYFKYCRYLSLLYCFIGFFANFNLFHRAWHTWWKICLGFKWAPKWN